MPVLEMPVRTKEMYDFEDKNRYWKHMKDDGWSSLHIRYGDSPNGAHYMWKAIRTKEFFSLLTEWCINLVKNGNIDTLLSKYILEAMKRLDICTDHQILELVNDAIMHSQDHDAILKIASKYRILTDELILKHARHSQNPTLRAQGMILAMMHEKI